MNLTHQKGDHFRVDEFKRKVDKIFEALRMNLTHQKIDHFGISGVSGLAMMFVQPVGSMNNLVINI